MKYVLSLAAAAAAVVILLEPSVIGDAVKGAVSSCLEVMIPSLFTFTVLAVYLQESGLYRTALRPLTLPLSKLLRLDEELCAVFVLSNIGGYPVGARLLSRLVSIGRLSRRDAGRMLCFCYGSGPSFVISIAGQRIFGSAAAGGVIFAACFLTSLIMGIVICRSGERIRLAPSDAAYDLSSGCFVSSVISAARVMFTVCTMIVCFSAVTAIIEITGMTIAAEALFSRLGAGTSSAYILPSLMEISRIQELPPIQSFAAPLCGMLLAFGGICVILQINAVVGDKLPLKPFLLSRVPAALLCGILSSAAIPFCGGTEQVSYIPVSAELHTNMFSVNAGMSLCVLVMCGMLLTFSRGK